MIGLEASPDGCADLSCLAGMAVAPLVHHRGSMLLLDRLSRIDEQGAACEWTVNAECALMVMGQGVPAYAGIECMAQCIAAHAGARARVQGKAPPIGLLLGTRQFHSSVDWLLPGETYQVECQELLRDEQGMASFDCRMLHQGKEIAACRLAVYEKEFAQQPGFLND
ncbi:MAG: hypothetical protein SH820_04445 [Xanthomonadales bacterium]|nr:hypothetical protein [Xanthomonadales bacterium]